MANMEDIYTQNAVKLENIKAGEANRIAAMLQPAQDRLMAKLEGDEPLTRKLYVDMMVEYYADMERIYRDQIIPTLDEDGKELAEQQIQFNEEALAEIITGKSTAERLSELEAEGYDIETPLYMLDENQSA